MIEILSNGNSNTAYCRANPSSRWWQLHKYKQPYLVNTKGKVLEVTGGVDSNMRKVGWNVLNKGKHQQWDLQYVDEIPRDPIKGELNKKYGFIVERDFYLITALPSRRMLSRVAENKLKIKVRNGMTN